MGLGYQTKSRNEYEWLSEFNRTTSEKAGKLRGARINQEEDYYSRNTRKLNFPGLKIVCFYCYLLLVH